MIKKTIIQVCIITASLNLNGQKIQADQKDRLLSIDSSINKLGQQIYNFWMKNGLDKKYGGFYGTLDENGKSAGTSDKGIIAESRHLWTFSTWYEYKEQSKEVKDVCDNLYRFIITGFYDSVSHEFNWRTDEKGKVLDLKKRLYSNSFAILGLSQYAKVFHDRLAAEYALKCFRAMDKRAHDPLNGGYNQKKEYDWVKGKGAVKETNTQIHLLESFTALYEVTKDSLVKNRLEEMLQVVAFKLPQPSGYMRLQFKANWTPVNEPEVSYGHDLETAWLIYDAARALNKTSDKSIVNQVIKIASSSGTEGFDSINGGYFTTGIPGKSVTDDHKTWWVQAEALNGLMRLYFLTGQTKWLDRIEKTISWIENYQVNKKTGEWYWAVNKKGHSVSTPEMGNFWKASYHNLRAMMFLDKWIKECK
jgi:cellobiose epimerase